MASKSATTFPFHDPIFRFYGDLYQWKDPREVVETLAGMELDQEDLRKIACNISNATPIV